MDEQYILHIGEWKYVMSCSEAMEIALTLNSCSRLRNKWIKDTPPDQSYVITPPTVSDVAFVVPMTGLLKMQVERNMQEGK